MQVSRFDAAKGFACVVKYRRTPGLFLIAAGAALLGGCSASLDQGLGEKLPEPSYLANAADKLTATATPGNSAYKIGPLDVLEISVFKVPELSRTLQVADAGSVNMPLVGEVTAAGKTAQDVEQDLSSRLGQKYLQSPQVSVFVKEYNSQRVTIDGAVKKPGVYPIRGRTTLLQFIAMAEGLDDTSDTSNIVVFRRDENKRMAARFDIDGIRAGTADDPEIKPGDVIIANGSQFKSMYTGFTKALPVAGFFLPFL